jgi:protein-S-isoprenylcysteine O-methyltransferase Ste14
VDAHLTLRRSTYVRVGRFAAVMLALILLSAGTLRYWQGWLFWSIFFACISFVTEYFLRHDPKLIERRSRAGPTAEEQTSQKIIQLFALMIFALMIILPGIDNRRGWSHLPAFLELAGNALVVLGLYIVFLVFQANSYASATIGLAANQRLITTGLYRFVRHPMYTGGLLMTLGIPLALGSGWALLLWPPMAAVMICRLIGEEKFLAANLSGYTDYRTATPYRLIPLIY